ncbi:MAG: 4'-phosphopantetheinyl transferase superfamily protein [Desulfobacterium sp.]
MILRGIHSPSPDLTFSLFPVVLKVPEHIRELPPPQRVKALGVLARESVSLSARQTGVTIRAFPKGNRGQPLPWRGVHWSLTHKPLYVAGVASLCSVGIDIELIKPVSSRLFGRICSEQETGLFHATPREVVFFRCFTAKEAVLKLHGVGLSGLIDVSVVDVFDSLHLEISYKGVFIRVEHFMLDGHLASIAGIRTHVVWRSEPHE